MEDRFRFRRWDKSKAKFMPVICIHPLLLQMIEERYVIMQCTGLKDKNGKLIFEKDYIKINNNKYKIIFNKYKISLVNIINNDIIDWEEQFNGEIIGNEYEGYFK